MHAERFDALRDLRRLRQVAARHAHGGRPPQPSLGVPLRRLDPAGPPQRRGARHRVACSRRSAPTPPARSSDEELRRHRAQRLPDRRLVRGDVHRQHDGVGRRGARHVAARAARAARRRPSPRRLRVRVGPGRHAPAARRTSAPATSSPRGRSRTPSRWRWRSGARPTRCCTCSRSPPRPRVDLELDDFNRVAERCPHLADTKPHGKYHMVDIDRVGGVPVVMRMLPEAGLLHGDEITVTGRTVAENLALIDPPAPDGEVIHRFDDPLHDIGGTRHPAGLAGAEGRRGQGRRHRRRAASRARPGCSTARTRAMEAVARRPDQRPATSLVIRYEGPKGGPGMREMLAITGCHEGRRTRRRHRAHHRRPVLRGHPRVLHRPRRARGRRRWPHRVRARRRPHLDRRRGPHHRPATSTPPRSRPRRADWKLPEPRYTRACSPSTPGSRRAPSGAPSPHPEQGPGRRGAARAHRRGPSGEARVEHPFAPSCDAPREPRRRVGWPRSSRGWCRSTAT